MEGGAGSTTGFLSPVKMVTFSHELKFNNYLFMAQAFACVLHMRQRHPQGFQLGAAGQQLSLQLVPLRLDSLRLRLQAGQLHWDARRNTFGGKKNKKKPTHFLGMIVERPSYSLKARKQLEKCISPHLLKPLETAGAGRRREGETERRRLVSGSYVSHKFYHALHRSSPHTVLLRPAVQLLLQVDDLDAETLLAVSPLQVRL